MLFEKHTHSRASIFDLVVVIVVVVVVVVVAVAVAVSSRALVVIRS